MYWPDVQSFDLKPPLVQAWLKRVMFWKATRTNTELVAFLKFAVDVYFP